jgi:hypothetical protein
MGFFLGEKIVGIGCPLCSHIGIGYLGSWSTKKKKSHEKTENSQNS